jgi:CheY-like chemotaxis protein
MTLEHVEFNLSLLLHNIHTVLAPAAATKKIQLYVEVDGEVPKNIIGDSTRLTQILMNLLGNAITYTPIGGKVTLKLRARHITADSVHLVFSVSDTGIGIAKENLDRIFYPFEQEYVSTNRKYGGTGLGLAISKMLTELMEGHIDVESEPDKGTTFTFDIGVGLPPIDDGVRSTVSTEGLDKPVAPKTEMPRTDCSDMVFLVVEDNELNQVVAENMLSQYGATIELANNGKEAVGMYLKNPNRYSAIFMDIQMPVMDGYAATRCIRESGTLYASTIPIIAMTASVFQEDIDKTVQVGMNAFVGKPLEPEQVANAIFRLFGC